jgi:hypothetical protein
MKQPVLLSALLLLLFGSIYSQTPAPASLTTQAGDGQIELTWSQVPGAVGYEIIRDGQTLQQIHDASDTTFADRGPVAGSVHFYCVRSLQASGTSPYINCIYDSSATNAFFASDSTSDAYIQLSWSLPTACLEAAGDEKIYMEIWDSTADEEFHNAIFDTIALPQGQDTSQYILL